MRRGINEEGEVANDVETEFFVIENFPFQDVEKNVCSFTMIRGSVPLFWGHEKFKLSPKPPIVLHEDKDPDQKSSVVHFNRLFKCYGDEICILNLVKSAEKSTESKLGNAYKKFVELFTNKLRTQHSAHKVRFRWFDFFSVYNKSERSLIRDLQIYGRGVLESLSLFRYGVFEGITTKQNGVIRVNCVDCLDRTNNAMACISSVVLAKILSEIGAEVKDLIDENTGAVKNELLSIVFDLFGVV